MGVLGFRLELREVRLKRPEFDLKRGLVRSPLLPWAPVEIDSSRVLPAIAREAPLGPDIVQWMHVAASDVAVFDAMSAKYNECGGKLASSSGDPYIPGVRAGDLRGESVSGYVVRERGYGTVITPVGSFNVPVRGKTTFAMRDILAWAALPDPGTWVQWVLTLLQWLELAKAPIRERIGFASSQGLVAPNFFSIPATPAPVRTLRIGLTSDKSQTVVIRGRGTKGSYHNVLFEDSFKVEAGESEVIYNVFGVPFVGDFTLEIAPSDNTQTILDYLEIFPPF